MTIIQPINRKVQVNVEIIVGVIRRIPDPSVFRSQIDLALFVWRGRVERRRFERVEIGHSLSDRERVLDDDWIVLEAAKAVEYVLRVGHCGNRELVTSIGLWLHDRRILTRLERIRS